MPILVDGVQRFGPGPAVVTCGPIQRVKTDEIYPGVRGLERLVIGGEHRFIMQTGLLRYTDSTSDLAVAGVQGLLEIMEGNTPTVTALAEGEHTLIDWDNQVYEHVTLDSVELTDRITVRPSGSSFEASAPYRAVWLQLDPTLEDAP
jgi:hypothetical protein